MDLEIMNEKLENLYSQDRIKWGLENFHDNLVLSTSFGKYSAVMLHLTKQISKDIPILFVDTGYLTNETYTFKRDLTKALGIEVHTFVPKRTRAEQEALHKDISELSSESKIQPFEKGLIELKAIAWMSGIMRNENPYRRDLSVILKRTDGIYKIHPIIDWDNKMCEEYLKKNNLPRNDNYLDIFKNDDECGIHLTKADKIDQSWSSSGL